MGKLDTQIISQSRIHKQNWKPLFNHCNLRMPGRRQISATLVFLHILLGVQSYNSLDESLIVPTSVYLCHDMQDYQIQCPHLAKISIISATHFLNPPGYLVNETRLCYETMASHDVTCNVHNTVTKPIRSICDKKSACRVSAKQFISQTQQTCRQTLLEIKYKCIPDEKQAINESICADSYIDVKCQGGLIIVKNAVTLASRHDQFSSACSANEEKNHMGKSCKDVEPINVTHMLSEYCNKKISCQVPPTANYKVPESLEGCSKLHLFISYICVPREFIRSKPSTLDDNPERLVKQRKPLLPIKSNLIGNSDFYNMPINYKIPRPDDDSVSNHNRQAPSNIPGKLKVETTTQLDESSILAESNKTLVLYSIIASIVGLVLIILLITTITLLCRKNQSNNNENQLKANLLRSSGYTSSSMNGGISSSGAYTNGKGMKHEPSFLSGPPTQAFIPTSLSNYQQHQVFNSSSNNNNNNQCASSPYCIGTSRSVSNSCLSHNELNSMFQQQINPIMGSPGKPSTRDDYNSLIGSTINYPHNSSCSNILFNQTNGPFDPEKSSSGMGSSLPRSSDHNCKPKSAFHQFNSDDAQRHGSDCSRSPAISYPPFPSFYSYMDNNPEQQQPKLNETKGRKVESFIKGVMNDYTSHLFDPRNSNESLPVFEPPEKFKSISSNQAMHPQIHLIGRKPSPLIANTSTDEDFCSLRSQIPDGINEEDVDLDNDLHSKTYLPPTMAPLRIDISQKSVVL